MILIRQQKYILNSKYKLRGWDKLPFALQDDRGRTSFIQPDMFEALTLCDGITDVSMPFIPDLYKEQIQTALKQGFVEPCSGNRALDPVQEYKRYENRFIGQAHWSITGRCNYRCRHCFLSAPDAKFGELSYDTCVEIIRQLAECGVGRVTLTGGECLVRDDFLSLVDEFLKNDIFITQIYSNGALVNERLLQELTDREVKPEFNMSFDGVGWHDWLRGVKGAEEAVTRAFMLCREFGFPTGAEMCLHRQNAHTLRESVNYLADLGVNSLKISPAVELGMWKDYSEHTLSTEAAAEYYLAYILHFYEDGMPLHLTLGGFFFCEKDVWNPKIAAFRFNGETDPGRQCLCGCARHTMHIGADGRVTPCISFDGMEENCSDFPFITELGLKQILTDSVYLTRINYRLDDLLNNNENCAACPYKYRCGGGCRASALNSGGDYMGSDKTSCIFLKNGYVSRLEALLENIKNHEGR